MPAPSSPAASRILGALLLRFGLFQLPIVVAVFAYPSFLAEALAIPFFLEKLMTIPVFMIIMEAFLLIMNKHFPSASSGPGASGHGGGGSVGAPVQVDRDASCCSPRGLCGAVMTVGCACCLRVPFVFRLLLVYLIQLTQISLILENDATGGGHPDDELNGPLSSGVGRLAKPMQGIVAGSLSGHTGAYVGDSLSSRGDGGVSGGQMVQERRGSNQHDQHQHDQQHGDRGRRDSRGSGSSEQSVRKVNDEGHPEPGGSGAHPIPSEPLTSMSVVLPCAGEGKYAMKTAESVFDSFPQNDRRYQLEEIIVVDDGRGINEMMRCNPCLGMKNLGNRDPSKFFFKCVNRNPYPGTQPPLEEEWLHKDFQQKYKVKIIRNHETQGLIGSKRIGGNAAKGDIITFFDCHVAPQGDWYKHFFRSVNENPKRIVMPVLTDLDIDTWTERTRNSGMAKCYLTFDADFKWFNSENDDIPILSGGLLALSKYWWEQTGGYDVEMKGWGGENLDQSLRSWLCGGEIVSLPQAYVAHMWRVGHDSRTSAKYHVPPGSSQKNRYRAAKAWMEPYVKKMDTEFGGFGNGRREGWYGDISNILEVKNRLKCHDFSWFIHRFRSVYIDGGLVPKETFLIQNGGKCLQYMAGPGTSWSGRGDVALQDCDESNDRQRWGVAGHWKTLRAWNTDQCLTEAGHSDNRFLGTAVCDVTGMQPEQHLAVTPSGQFVIRPESGGGKKCLTRDGNARNCDGSGGGMEALFSHVKKGGGAGGPGDEGLKDWKLIGHKVPLEFELYKKSGWMDAEAGGSGKISR